MLDRMQLLEGPRVLAARRRPWSYPAATMLHLGLIGAGVIASMFATTAVTDPDVDIDLVFVTAPPAGAMPKYGGGTAGPPRPKPPRDAPAEPVQPPATAEPLQPQTVDPLHEIAVSPADPAAPGSDEPGGDGGPGGGGDPDGVPYGVPDGVPCPGGKCPDGVGGTGLPGQGTPSAEPLYVTDRITEPVLERRVEPEYPETARRVHVSGKVVLRAVISETGDVERVTVLKGHPLLDSAATSAVAQWKYRPARLDGTPVRVYFTVVVTFSLE